MSHICQHIAIYGSFIQQFNLKCGMKLLNECESSHIENPCIGPNMFTAIG